MFKKISVGLDGSDSSINALSYAVKLAADYGSELLLVSAVEPIYPLSSSAMYPGGTPSYMPQFQEDLRKSIDSIQKTHLKRLREEYPDLKVSGVIEDGRASTVITEASEDADLIVIGHRGHGGVLSWVLGSTAKEIVDRCTSPVFVAKKEDYC